MFLQREHSDHDVEIAPGIGDGEYLKVLQTWLPFLFDTYAPELVFYQVQCKLFVFHCNPFWRCCAPCASGSPVPPAVVLETETKDDPDDCVPQAGVDPFERDQLGKLSLTRSGLQKRNSLVLQFSQKHGAKLVLTLGGGCVAALLPVPTPLLPIMNRRSCPSMCAL